ncbi:MAG: tRNA (adenosine(37)-N6)-threonylcarbamoyltransferase complex dimerization subunit type 1 TsaB [Brachybacterium sp.]|nr:tRNA (adenosine(37)-N6)-threonylcarbamoyltransferase complex dimerization subunit type 1 TsaB [Brachybacterium sp.]
MHLGIDTSGAVSVAIGRPGEDGELQILATRADERARHHDEVLMTAIDGALADAGVRRTELTRVVAGRGPGPFTGLRVGLVVARTIAAALDLELVGVSSLDALAHQALAEDPTPGTPRTVAVALDARRREVYHARYQATDGTVATLERVSEPAVDLPADIAAQLSGCDLVVGSGARLYADLLAPTTEHAHADAGHLLQVAALLASRGEDLSSTEPLYLRAPDAAKPTARKSALGR